MPKDQKTGLTGWVGDTASLLAEMKRRAGVDTDQELARYLGVAQSTVSHWRVRLRIPEAALLRAERLLSAAGAPAADRKLAATMVALRMAEFWFQRAQASGLKGSRALFYKRTAVMLPAILENISEQLRAYERETGVGALELASQLLDDETFLERLMEFAKSVAIPKR